MGPVSGRLVLRRGVGAWSAGTVLCRRGAQPDDVIVASPWGSPDVLLRLMPGDVVERRQRGGAVRPQPPQERKKHPPIFATSHARMAAREAGVAIIENEVERSLRSGRTRRLGKGALVVELDHAGVVAVVRPFTSRSSGRRAFVVVGVRRAA